MNLRKPVYLALVRVAGYRLGSCYRRFWREVEEGIPPDTTKKLLVGLLEYCRLSGPYYAEVMRRVGDSFRDDPVEYLRDFPILTKDIIRSRFDDLKSRDLNKRKWGFNTSGGSTGVPVRFIQDREHSTKDGAIKLVYSRLAGKDIGEREVDLWGSVRDILGSKKSWKGVVANKISNTTMLSVFRMTPDDMRRHIDVINTKRPRLILAYAEGLYELAKFADRENLEVRPQHAIMTTVATLFPHMRRQIEKVFQCPVYDRYGSRETGDIACERPGFEGHWVAPWSNYVEIVDPEGRRLPPETAGEIVVTSLINYAMPLVRYRIGDRGILAPTNGGAENQQGQCLSEVLGRTCEIFINKKGDIVEATHFMPLLFFRDWILKYQVIQKGPEHIVFRIVKGASDPKPGELDEIAAKTGWIMGDDCRTTFEFTDEILPSPSGKYRYIISEVPR